MSRRGSRVRKWRIGRPKQEREGNPEERWGRFEVSKVFRNWVLVGALVLLGAGGWILPELFQPDWSIRAPLKMRRSGRAFNSVAPTWSKRCWLLPARARCGKSG